MVQPGLGHQFISFTVIMEIHIMSGFHPLGGGGGQGGHGGNFPPKHLTLIELSSIKSQQYAKLNYLFPP